MVVMHCYVDCVALLCCVCVEFTKNSVDRCGWWLKVDGVIGKPTHTFSCCQAVKLGWCIHTLIDCEEC